MEKRKPEVERNSFTIVEFCERNHLSLPTFRRLMAAGRGPAVARFSGRLSRISVEAEAEWLRAMTTPPDEVQQEIEHHAVQARAAARKGFLSEQHIAKRNAKKAAGV